VSLAHHIRTERIFHNSEKKSVNYMVTSVLYDQFRTLNSDFRRAVGDSGDFKGNIREFRRHHQRLALSVQNADKFMMISNIAGFCCQIMNVILIGYCMIFFRHETNIWTSLRWQTE